MFTLSSVSCTKPIAVPGSAGVGVGVTAGAAVGEPPLWPGMMLGEPAASHAACSSAVMSWTKLAIT